MYQVSCFYHKVHNFFTYLPHYEEQDTLLEGLLTSLELQPYDQAEAEPVLPGSEEFGNP